MKLSPIELEFILFCRYSLDEYFNLHSPVIQKFIQKALELELILPTPTDEIGGKCGVYSLTERGNVWLDDILKTPLPIKKWVSGKNGKE